MRAFMELAGALKGTIVVALRRTRPRTLAIGGAVAALVLGGMVVVLTGSGDGGPDGPAAGRSGAERDVRTDREGRAESDPDLADPGGRPLIDGVASHATPGGESGGTTTAEGPGGAGEARGPEVVLDDDTPMAGEPATPVVPHPDTPPEPTSTSTVARGSSTTTEGPTTTTTEAAGSSSGGGLLGGLLDLLGLG